MRKLTSVLFYSLLLASIVLTACGGAGGTKKKVGVVLDTGGENDKSFNEYTLKGARQAAQEAGFDISYVVSQSTSDYEKNIETQISEGANMVVTVGFLMGDATAAAAKKYPDVQFAIVDVSYFPGFGCDAAATDCYTAEGGLPNITSLMFAEDQVGYLAGVLAGCMSQTGVIATVSGMEIPPVVKFVVGYQTGAKSVNPGITTLNQYIPDFNDPATGKTVGQSFLTQKADVIFGVGGNTGNGGLLAAKEAGLMAIGVDVDQYNTYPEVKDALLTSAAKNMDVATGAAVKDFAAGSLKAGIRTATVASGGVGLAPYHDWDSKIPQDCKDKVNVAVQAVRKDPSITGYKP